MKISRRALLVGAAVGALTLSPAGAILHRSGGGTPKVGINIDLNPEISLFRNWANNLESFQALNGTFAYPAILNADGYIEGTLPSELIAVIPFPSNITTSTSITIAWTGQATNGASTAISVSGGFTGFNVTSSTNAGQGLGATSVLNLHGTNGVIVFNCTGSFASNVFSIGFQSGATFSGFSGFIFCQTSDYTTVLNATTPAALINPDFITAMKTLRTKYLRTMDWQNINQDNFTQRQYRYNWQTALSFTSSAWIPNLWAGGPGTAGPNITRNVTTNAYTCAAATNTPASYTMGEIIQGQFDLASNGTGSATINVGGRGVVPLFEVGGNAVTVQITANALTTLIYDDLFGGYIVYAPEEGGPSGLSAGIPDEILVSVANQIGCALWYNFPPHITISSSVMEATSSVAQIAAYVAANLNGNAYFEFANEVWNSGFNFNSFAAHAGTNLGFPDNTEYSYYGLRVAQIMPQVRTAFASRSASLKCVIAFQMAGPGGVSGQTNKYNFQGFYLNTSSGFTKYNSYIGINYNTFPTRPIDVCDTMAYAGYYNGSQCRGEDISYSNPNSTGLLSGGPAGWTTGLLGACDAYASGGSTNISNALNFMDWDTRQGTIGQTCTIGGDTKTFTAPTSTGLSNGSAVLFTTTGTIFTGITVGTVYYMISVSGATFQVSLTRAGSAVTGISGGTGVQSFGITSNETLLDLKSAAVGTGYYPQWETIAQSYDGARPSGLSNLTIEWYEGGYQSNYIQNLTTCFSLGISTSSTVTLAIGSNPMVSWTAHGLPNGALVGFSTTGALPAGVSSYNAAAGQGNNGGTQYYVVNATTNSFDIATSPGGAAITATGTQSGTQTATACKYGGKAGTLAVLLAAYKNSNQFYNTVLQQFNDFFTTPNVLPSLVNHSVSAVWFDFADGSQWSLYPGPDVYYTPYQSYSAISAYNRTP